ncbi:bacterial Ig-like domain-containing protein [Enterococcus faecalis]
MKKIFSLFLFLLFLCVNQELIAFAEIANVQAEKKIDNNMSNDTGILPKIINHELSGSSITAKYIDPYEIIIGDSFSNEYPIISAKDELNNDIDFSKFTYAWKYRPPVNPSIVGDWSVLSIYYNFPDGSGGYTRDVTVKVVGKDGRRAELKDTVLYTGQKWDLGSIFKYATDRDGYFINLEKINDVWIDGQKTREIDTSRPGKHSVQIGVSSPRTKPLVVSNVGTVIVKEDQTKAELKDTELYVNQKWDLGSVFKNVVDKDGNPIKPEEINDVWIDGQKTREIDTSKPSKHIVQIAVRSATNDWVYSNKVTVTVEDKSSIKTKNSTRYIGQAWGQIDNFVSATDEEGKNVPFQDSRIRMDGATAVDLSKPGVYKVTYIFDGKFKQVKSESTVTVLEDQTKAELKDTELYASQKWDLGSVFKNVVDKDGNPIKPEEINGVWIDGQKTREIDTSKPGKHTVKIAVLNAYNEWVYSNEVTVTVKEPFTIKQVPYFDFEDHILVSTNKSVVNKKENPTIELETPSIEGKDWQLQVELSPFLDKKNSKSVLKGVSLFIPKGRLESDLATEEPTQYDCQLEANGKASILMHGTKTKGKGRWKNKLATKEITLSIPPENKKGNYESTLHWTLLDVP